MDRKRIVDAKIADYAPFSFEGVVTIGKLMNNYDGDTGELLILWNDQPTLLKVRFFGYDSAELKPPLNSTNRCEIITRAKAAKSRLWQLCTGTAGTGTYHTKLVTVVCGKFDKYGRVLVTVFDIGDVTATSVEEDFDKSINHTMVIEGHGIPYHGGSRTLL